MQLCADDNSVTTRMPFILRIEGLELNTNCLCYINVFVFITLQQHIHDGVMLQMEPYIDPKLLWYYEPEYEHW